MRLSWAFENQKEKNSTKIQKYQLKIDIYHLSKFCSSNKLRLNVLKEEDLIMVFEYKFGFYTLKRNARM